jgi:hypothetical protein
MILNQLCIKLDAVLGILPDQFGLDEVQYNCHKMPPSVQYYSMYSTFRNYVLLDVILMRRSVL